MDILDVLRRTGGLPPSAFHIPPTPVSEADPREETKDKGAVHDRNLNTVSNHGCDRVIPFKSTSTQEGNSLSRLEPLLSGHSLPCIDDNAATPSSRSLMTKGIQGPINRLAQRRCTLSDDTKYALEKAFSQTLYPDRDMLARVASYTGLSILKVTTWFNNNRARRLKRKHGTAFNNIARLGSCDANTGPASSSSVTTSNASPNIGDRLLRQGRRVIGEQLPEMSVLPNDGRLRFYCAFCFKIFYGRFEWNRHEESIHVQRTVWICNKSDIKHTPTNCQYCLVPHPSPQHLEEHNHKRCKDRPELERTFLRRDHLVQHFVRFHHCTQELASKCVAKASATPAEPLEPNHAALHCGYCGQRSTNWDDRVNHICGHYKTGVDPLDWWTQRVDNTSMPSDADIQRQNQQCDCKRFRLLRLRCNLGRSFNWSCSFLPSAKEAFVSERNNNCEMSRCCFCRLSFDIDKTEDWSSRVHHLETKHNYRGCAQMTFHCAGRFVDHLKREHAFSGTKNENFFRHYGYQTSEAGRTSSAPYEIEESFWDSLSQERPEANGITVEGCSECR